MTPVTAATMATVVSTHRASGNRYDVFTKYSPKTSRKKNAETTNAARDDPYPAYVQLVLRCLVSNSHQHLHNPRVRTECDKLAVHKAVLCSATLADSYSEKVTYDYSYHIERRGSSENDSPKLEKLLFENAS